MAKESTTKAKAAPVDPAPTQTPDVAPQAVDIDALREQIRAEEAEKLRAESVARQEAADARQAELDAAKADHVQVVCPKGNVHTSKGKMTEGVVKHLPEAEAAMLAKKGLVKPV